MVDKISLADEIVARATAVPSADTLRRSTSGIMSRAVIDAGADDYNIQNYISDYLATIREERTPYRAQLPDTFDDNTYYRAELPQRDYVDEFEGDSNIPLDDPDLQVTGNLASLVKGFEGYSSTAYWDKGQWSIGHGTKASGEGATITKAEAEAALNSNLASARSTVVAHQEKYGYDWSENQVDALTSFTYNLGAGGLSQLTDNGSRGDDTISEMMLEYNKADGETLPGLTKRRQVESKLFTQGYD